jgi:Glycosyltransferase family 9 (heptosyltransferase)
VSTTDRSEDRIAIILPNRVGDAILSLPLLVCLRDLIAHYGPARRTVALFSATPLAPVFESVGVAGLMPMGRGAKFRSWLTPWDKGFFLIATSKNIGFRVRSSYGLRQRNKPLARYTHDLSSLRGVGPAPELRGFLSSSCNLHDYSIAMFGVIEALGYTFQQVQDSFFFSRNSLPLDSSRFEESPVSAPYLVCCMEAAYGSKKSNADRRWNREHFLTLAERVRTIHNCRVVFIGLDREVPISQVEGFIDLRAQLSLWQLFQLMAGAVGYLGNDTGPLHLANLAGIPSVGIYARDDIRYPLFNESNTVLVRPSGPDDVYPAVCSMLEHRGMQSCGNVLTL